LEGRFDLEKSPFGSSPEALARMAKEHHTQARMRKRTPMIDVLLIEDHVLVRQGLKRILGACSDIVVAGEAGTAAEALDMIRSRPYNVVVLDIGLPDRSGLDLLVDIKAVRPNLPILILSIYDEENFGARSIQLGAAGYLSKKSAARDFIVALRKVAGGGKCLNGNVTERLLDLLGNGNGHHSPWELSQRELQVMDLIARGESTAEIAQGLSLKMGTISTYRRRIFEKTGLACTAEIVRYANKMRLFSNARPTP
jgi:two-component system invasion response regulator UvrY